MGNLLQRGIWWGMHITAEHFTCVCPSEMEPRCVWFWWKGEEHSSHAGWAGGWLPHVFEQQWLQNPARTQPGWGLGFDTRRCLWGFPFITSVACMSGLSRGSPTSLLVLLPYVSKLATACFVLQGNAYLLAVGSVIAWVGKLFTEFLFPNSLIMQSTVDSLFEKSLFIYKHVPVSYYLLF